MEEQDLSRLSREKQDETVRHGYTMIACVNGVWYTRIAYDDGAIIEFYTAACIASEGRF